MTMTMISQNAAEVDGSLSRIIAYIVVVRQQWKRIKSNVYFNLGCDMYFLKSGALVSIYGELDSAVSHQNAMAASVRRSNCGVSTLRNAA